MIFVLTKIFEEKSRKKCAWIEKRFGDAVSMAISAHSKLTITRNPHTRQRRQKATTARGAAF